jgi:WD40 repeat protein
VKLDLRDPAMPPEAIVRFNEHNKYNVETRWSPDGQYLATVSHDKSVNLYKRRYGIRYE